MTEPKRQKVRKEANLSPDGIIREHNQQHQVVLQFSNAEGAAVGPQVHLSLETTRGQLQQVLNELRETEETAPCSFRLIGPEGQEVEIDSDLQTALAAVPGVTSETVISITFFPLAVFRVRPVTRCTSSLEGHSEAVLAVSFSPDCRYLASGSGDTTVCIWDLDTETPLITLKGHTNWVMTVCWSPCSRLLASAGMDKNVCVWNVDGLSKNEIVLKGHSKGVSCLAWQPLHLLKNGQSLPLLASASLDCTIRIWDVSQRNSLMTLSGHCLPVTRICFSGDAAQRLYSCSRDSFVKVWDITETGTLLDSLKGHGHWINTMALNTELKTQVGCFDHTIESRRLSDPRMMAEAAAQRYEEYFKFSCGGRERLVTGSDDCSMILWEPATSKKPIARLNGHQQPVNHVQFSSDGRVIASASFDKSVRLWDALSGKYLGVLRGHVGPVYRLAWSSDSNFLVTASSDSTVKVWDIQKKKLKEDLPGHADEVYAVDWSIDGSKVASGSKDRFVKIWRH